MTVLFVFFTLVSLIAADWPIFGGDSAHSGYKKISLLSQGTEQATLSWSKTLMSPLTYSTIADEHVYTIVAGLTLFVLNSTNGDQLRSVSAGGGSSVGPPIVDKANGHIIVNKVGGNEGLYVDAYSIGNNYANVWTATAGSQWAHYPYGVTPSDTQDVIYFAGGTYNNYMHAVNANDGSFKFTVPISTGYGCDWWTPTVYEGRVFMNDQPGEGVSGFLQEIDKTTGAVLWTVDLDSDWDGYSAYWTAAIADNIAIVHSRTSAAIQVSAIDINSQQNLWAYPCTKPHGFTGAFTDYTASTDGEHVFVTCADGVKSLDLLNGVLFQAYDCSNCNGKPIVTKDAIIVNSDDGVKIFDKHNGNLTQTLSATGMIALDQNKLYVTNAATGVIAAWLFPKPFQATTEFESTESQSSSTTATNINTEEATSPSLEHTQQVTELQSSSTTTSTSITDKATFKRPKSTHSTVTSTTGTTRTTRTMDSTGGDGNESNMETHKEEIPPFVYMAAGAAFMFVLCGVLGFLIMRYQRHAVKQMEVALPLANIPSGDDENGALEKGGEGKDEEGAESGSGTRGGRNGKPAPRATNEGQIRLLEMGEVTDERE